MPLRETLGNCKGALELVARIPLAELVLHRCRGLLSRERVQAGESTQGAGVLGNLLPPALGPLQCRRVVLAPFQASDQELIADPFVRQPGNEVLASLLGLKALIEMIESRCLPDDGVNRVRLNGAEALTMAKAGTPRLRLEGQLSG